MARPQKNNCDYFPHDSSMRNHIKIKAIRNKFPNGYAIWVMFLEYLTGSDGNVFEYSDLQFELLSGDFGFTTIEIRNVIEYAIQLEMIFNNAGFINSESLDERLAPVYTKRGLAKEQSARQKRINGKFATETTDVTVVSVTETPITVTEKPQSKKKETKVKKTILSCFSFDDFWKIYPNTKGKEDARKKFDKLSESDKSLIKSTINKFISDIPFIGYNHPMAATYINKKRWLDYVTAITDGTEGVYVDFEKLTDDGYGRTLSVGGCYNKLLSYMEEHNTPEIRKACLPKLIEYGLVYGKGIPEISWHDDFKKLKEEAESC